MNRFCEGLLGNAAIKLSGNELFTRLCVTDAIADGNSFAEDRSCPAPLVARLVADHIWQKAYGYIEGTASPSLLELAASHDAK